MVKILLLIFAFSQVALASFARADAVNMDDPNMAITTDFVNDSAVTCSKNLKGKRLHDCLAKNGLSASDASSEEISGDVDVLSQTTTRSVH